MNLEEKIDKLSRFQFIISAFPSREIVIAYIKGFIEGGEKNREIIKLIQYFLKEKYGIDDVLNLWEDQVNHFLYIKNLSWSDGFPILLNEIKAANFFEIEEIDYFDQGSKIEMGIPIEKIEKYNIEIGSIVKLGNKLGDIYKDTKLYNGRIQNPNWELFYPSIDDFKNIVFFSKQKEDEAPVIWKEVPRIFSDLTVEIIDIRKYREKVFLYTELFRIDFDKALKGEEIIINENITYRKKDKSLIDNLSETIFLYRIGAYSILILNSFPKLIAGRTLDLIGSFEHRIWQNYYRGSAGNWMKIKH